MQPRKSMSRVAALWAIVATPVWALSGDEMSFRVLEAADLVAIATPIERRIVDANAFIRRSDRDSLPVTTIEVQFETVLGIKGVSWPDTFTLRYHLRREAAEVPAEVRIGSTVMRWYAWRPSVFIGDPRCRAAVDSFEVFNPNRTAQFLLVLKRTDEAFYGCARCDPKCIRRLKECYRRDTVSSPANRPSQPPAPQGDR